MGGWASILVFCSVRAGGRRDFVVENRVGVGGRPDTPGPVGGPVLGSWRILGGSFSTLHPRKHAGCFSTFGSTLHSTDFLGYLQQYSTDAGISELLII